MMQIMPIPPTTNLRKFIAVTGTLMFIGLIMVFLLSYTAEVLEENNRKIYYEQQRQKVFIDFINKKNEIRLLKEKSPHIDKKAAEDFFNQMGRLFKGFSDDLGTKLEANKKVEKELLVFTVFNNLYLSNKLMLIVVAISYVIVMLIFACYGFYGWNQQEKIELEIIKKTLEKLSDEVAHEKHKSSIKERFMEGKGKQTKKYYR